MNASGLWQSATGLFNAGLRQTRQAFGYDAVDTGEGKRRAPSGVTRSEDDELPVQKRRKLLSQTRDLARNFALLGWAIRQHLNYITTFNFQPKTGNRRLNQKLAAFLENWSEPENFDVAGITPLWNFIRLAEVRRCIDGDMLALKLANGQVQAIEGDRLLSPRTAPRETAARNWFHGVELDRYGRHLAYAVHRRGKSNDFGAVGSSQFVFERAVPAHQALLFAHRERFDQVRGITPLTAAINSLVDTQEGIDFISAKLKARKATFFIRGSATRRSRVFQLDSAVFRRDCRLSDWTRGRRSRRFRGLIGPFATPVACPGVAAAEWRER